MIFVYVAISVFFYMKKEKIQFYEVVEGSIVAGNTYTGIILRDEEVQFTDRAGYINYYVQEGKRAAVGTSVYSIDETGDFANLIASSQETQTILTKDNLESLKRQISNFSMSYKPENFDKLYNFQYGLEASVLDSINFNVVENMGSLIEESGQNFQQVKTPVAGVVSYWIDGFEEITTKDITEAMFHQSEYESVTIKAGQLVEKDIPAYKMIPFDNWSIIFQLKEEDSQKYAQSNQVTVFFPVNQITLNADFSLFTGADGKTYGKLSFEEYMIQFIGQRYVDFEIELEAKKGLKIPRSSVVEKEFLVVPVDYMMKSGAGNDSGFAKETYTAEGTVVEFVPTTIYYSTENFYYIDKKEGSVLQAGDYLVKPDSDERFQLSQSAWLEGVYNINKGYAVFKQIDVLSTNDEYYIIKKGTSYGVSVYDYIALVGSVVEEDSLLYQ